MASRRYQVDEHQRRESVLCLNDSAAPVAKQTQVCRTLSQDTIPSDQWLRLIGGRQLRENGDGIAYA